MRSALVWLGLAACAPVAPVSVAAPASTGVDRLAWLEGTWESEEGDSRNVETWWVEGDALRGTNITWQAGNEVHREELELLQVAGVITYRAAPQGQAANDFALVTSDGSSATFEDPAHDWPQRIQYVRHGDDLKAVVSGLHEGSRTATWSWHRER
jgi:hypothetical protein